MNQIGQVCNHRVDVIGRMDCRAGFERPFSNSVFTAMCFARFRVRLDHHSSIGAVCVVNKGKHSREPCSVLLDSKGVLLLK